MSKRTLLWWIPAAAVAVVALVEGGMHVGAHAAKRAPAAVSCATRELAIDVDGDGRPETLRLVRVGDQAWADVWAGAAMRSTTRLGAWHEVVALEAMDVNGDGKADLVRRWADGRQEHAEVWLSDGTAFEAGWSGTGPRTCIAQR